MLLCKLCKTEPVDLSRSTSKCTRCLEKLRQQKNEWAKTHREILSAKQKKYYQENKPKCIEYSREYIKAHPEKAKKYHSRHYQSHKAEHAEYQKARREKYNAYNRKYYNANLEKVKTSKHKTYLKRKGQALQEWRNYRARKQNAEGKFTKAEWEQTKDKYGNRCLCCGSTESLTADHIVPLKLGGTNYISNIQPLCKSCNSRKGAKVMDYRPQGQIW